MAAGPSTEAAGERAREGRWAPGPRPSAPSRPGSPAPCQPPTPGRARRPRAVAVATPAPPPAASSAPPPAGRRGRGAGWEGAGGGRRREEIGSATPAAYWLPRLGAASPASLEGAHVIPFKDGRPVVLMNNTWWGEGVRVGVEG